MLPSVGAGSAAHRIYAQAVASATHDSGARDAVAAVRPDRDAGARGDGRPAPEVQPDEAEVVRVSKAAVDALLELLHARVLAALIEAGLSRPAAVAAADEAAATLASAIATDTRHAAQIVHAVTERLVAGEALAAPALLHLAARGLTIVVGPAGGPAQVSLDALDIHPPDGIDPAPHHHLVDFTDAHSEDAARILRIFGEVRAKASAAAAADTAAVPDRAPRTQTASAEAAVPPVPSALVSPGVFADAIREKLAPALAAAGYPADAATPFAKAVSRVLAAALAQPDKPHGLSSLAAATEAVGRLAPLHADAAAPSEDRHQASAPASSVSRIVLAAGPLTIVVAPRDGSVTVRIANQAVAVAPASLAPPTAWVAPLADIDALPLPAIAFAGRAQSPVAVEPAVPLSAAAGTADPLARAVADAAAPDAAKPDRDTAKAVAAALDAETVRLIETAVARNATLFRALLAAPADGTAGTMRISLDIGAVVGTVPPVPVEISRVGRFGLPQPAPAQGEKGPVRADGHADAAAVKPPVLPPWHALGEMPRIAARPLPKPETRQRKLSYGVGSEVEAEAEDHAESDDRSLAAPDDAFTRDMPEGFEGVVPKSVKVSA
jgi:hypothetical protein